MNTTRPNEIVPHVFGENLIRTTLDNGNIMFCAKDVCAILGLENNRQAISKLDADEKGVTISDTLGGPQAMTYVTEPGIYRLIFKSRKAEAKVFQRWVFHEVLPQIRKTGSFSPNHIAHVNFVADLIALGVSPDKANASATVVGKLNPIPLPTSHPAHPRAQEISEILELFQPGEKYTVQEIALLLPPKHRLCSTSEAGRRSTIGQLCKLAIEEGRLEKHFGKDRIVRYQLPTIATFKKSAD